MTHSFFEFDITPGVPTVPDLDYVLRDTSKQTQFAISEEVALFVRQNLLFSAAVPSLANCNFAFRDGEFVEFDSKGRPKRFSEPVPAWFVQPGEFSRTEWLSNHELSDLRAPEFIAAFTEKFPDLAERRKHADLIFDLQLSPSVVKNLQVKTPGNHTGRSTKPKVIPLPSFKEFSEFFHRLKTAVNTTTPPTIAVLCGVEDISKVPARQRQAIRTAMKAVTGELPVNNKKLEKLESEGAESFCAPIASKVSGVEKIGLETYYKAMTEAVNQYREASGEDGGYISDFEFAYKA